MIMTEDLSLRNFDFWGGALHRVSYLTNEELDIIELELEELYPDGMSKTMVNDIFWFEFDWIAKILGYENEEDFLLSRSEEK